MMRRFSIFAIACSITFFAPSLISAQEKGFVDPKLQFEPQPRGPVHDAFAQPDPQPEPGPIAPQKPPVPIPEVPPDMAPSGNNMQWIPGYWAWDSEKGEFLWVSGTYRNAPAERQYVPGYWTEADGGWRWVQGYWAPTGSVQPAPAQQQLPQEYLPQPPAPLTNGPSTAGPPDAVYAPGYWAYQNQTYAWKPGYYYQVVAGRMWIPPRYVWTPRGYVFVPGYWDNLLEDRGLLFAPVVFSRPLWNDPAWSYTPIYTVNTGLLLDNLFCCGPSFWFGNCYGRRGFAPWYTRGGPYLAYYRWAHRGDPDWYGGLQRNYAARANGALAVPTRGDWLVPLNRVANVNRLNAAQVNAHRAAAARTRDLGQQRLRHETLGRNQVVRPAAAPHPAATPHVSTPAAVKAAHTPATKAHVATTQHSAPQVHAPAHHAAPAHHPAPAHHAAPFHHAAPAYRPAPAHHAKASHHTTASHHSGHKH